MGEVPSTRLPLEAVTALAVELQLGVIWQLSEVFQIQQDGEYGGILLLSVTDEGYDIWDDNIWIDYDKAIGAAEDDIITVYGTLTGSKSYETQIGGETYVPRMHARYFETG